MNCIRAIHSIYHDRIIAAGSFSILIFVEVFLGKETRHRFSLSNNGEMKTWPEMRHYNTFIMHAYILRWRQHQQ